VVGRPAPAAPSRSAPWPPRRARSRPQPDLDTLTGLRSGKPHYFPEHRTYAERLRRVILALERISAALMHTTEGSEALVRAVVEAAAEHLCADWVVFALVDGELTESRPRHLVRGPDGAEWPDVGAMPAMVREHLLAVLHRLRDEGNTVIVIEHNLDVIKTADWVIDLGPEGGDGGGTLVAEGTPEQLARAANSFTGRYLKRVLARGKKAA